MSPSTEPRERPTPYANYRFRVVLDGRCVLGVSKVSGLAAPAEAIRDREGRGPAGRRPPDRTGDGAIVLERGVSYDTAFQQWATPQADPSDRRRELTLELYDEAGRKVIAYRIRQAWVSELRAMPELDGTGAALVVESMTVQNQSWDRDGPDPATPSLDLS